MPKRAKDRKPTVRLALSEARVRDLAPPAKGRRTVFDARTPALCLTVTARGKKTWYLYRRIHGRPARVSLGRWPDVAVEAARKAAVQLGGRIAAGANPAAERRKEREAATLADAFARFMLHVEAHDRPNTGREYRRVFGRYLGGLARRRLGEIERRDVEALHARIGKGAPYMANRLLALLSAIYGRAAPDVPNPTKGVRRFREHARERFLDADELRRFFVALDAEPSDAWRAAFALALLTGARRSNVLGMRWADLDLARGLWHVPAKDAKSGDPMVLVLVPAAVAVLRRRAADLGPDAGEWVFPGVGKSGHLEEPKKVWRALLKRAALVDAEGKNAVRLHDLRRTLGSWQAAAGASLSIIGRSLGHKSLQATQVYARLDVEPIRKSVEAATAAMMEAANGAAPKPAAPPLPPPPAGLTPGNRPTPDAAPPKAEAPARPLGR
jgi:integrase